MTARYIQTLAVAALGVAAFLGSAGMLHASHCTEVPGGWTDGSSTYPSQGACEDAGGDDSGSILQDIIDAITGSGDSDASATDPGPGALGEPVAPQAGQGQARCNSPGQFSFPGEEANNKPGGATEGIPDKVSHGGSPPGEGGYTHVPVRDFNVHDKLEFIAFRVRGVQNNTANIVSNTSITAQNTGLIEEDTAAIEEDTSLIRYYLRQLCLKEFDLDPKIQHQWMEVMTNLVKYTVDFISTAYNGNPIFVSNPYEYYRRVDENVVKSFTTEVDVSVGPEGLTQTQANRIKEAIEQASYASLWPDVIAGYPAIGPQTVEKITDQTPEQLSTNFDAAGGWNAFHRLFVSDTGNTLNLINLAKAELTSRRQTAREIEKEKLAWGRGFFSWEICDDNAFTVQKATEFSTSRTEVIIGPDRRNCRIYTPGSLIQDHASLVLGSVVRQIENADEYEEWISAASYMALNNVFNNYGIRRFAERDPETGRNFPTGGAVGPDNLPPLTKGVPVSPRSDSPGELPRDITGPIQNEAPPRPPIDIAQQ